MKNSDSIKQIIPALLKAQQAIEFAVKDATNPHFRSKYADLPAVIDAIKKPLNDNGIVFMQIPADDKDGYVGVETTLLHTSGEWISGTSYCPIGNKNDPQGYGSALTYLRRYSLGSVVGLYSDLDDDGNAASVAKKVATQAPKQVYTPITDDSLNRLNALCLDEKIKAVAEEQLKAKKMSSFSELNEESAKKFINWLEGKK